jgi:hypothetical protein
MDILAAIKREERKLEKQLGKLNHKLSGVRAPATALGHSAEREVVTAGEEAGEEGRQVPTSSFEVLVIREFVVASP